MSSQQHILALVWIAAVIWAVLLIFHGVALPSGFFEPASAVVGAVVLILGVFDRWAWRWRLFHPWFVSTPDLNGTWKGQLLSSWTDPKTGSGKNGVEVYLVVRQTLSAVQARLITRESTSELLAGQIIQNGAGLHVLIGMYRNIPKMLQRKDSPIHHGGILLSVHGEPPHALDGEYWTDRDTKGELRFTTKIGKLFYDFDSASCATFEEISS